MSVRIVQEDGNPLGSNAKVAVILAKDLFDVFALANRKIAFLELTWVLDFFLFHIFLSVFSSFYSVTSVSFVGKQKSKIVRITKIVSLLLV